jgi:hypothetical protein
MPVEYEKILEPLLSTLEADGYSMNVQSAAAASDQLTITVTAGPDACEECLVPLDLFKAIVTQCLSDSGVNPSLDIIYPKEA